MKRIILLVASGLTGLMSLAACSDFGGPDMLADEGALIVSVDNGPGTFTKAETRPIGKDGEIRDIQLFLFSSDGTLYRRESFEGRSETRTLGRIKAGSYDVVAVANAPELTEVSRKSELEQTGFDLSLNHPDRGFLMYGQTVGSVTVTGGATAPARAEIRVRRHVGRVRLTTVENGLPVAYGALKVECAFLENCLGMWNYGGVGAPSDYLNHAGRKAGCSLSTDAVDYIRTASDAECPDLTFRMLSRSIAGNGRERFDLPFYTLPNKHTSATDNFAGATDGDACTRLVIRASYGESGAQSWYYPVTIENLERNKSYDVSFRIRGPGSPDPNKKVENSNLEVTVTVDPWGDGGDFYGEF